MSQSVTVTGTVTVGDGACTPSSTPNQCVRSLQLGPCLGVGLAYEGSVVARVTISTAGAIGANFVDIAALQQFTSIEFLHLVTSSTVRLRLTRPDASTTDGPDIEGTQIYQFPRAPGAPTAIQASGVATIDIIAAGRVSA